MKKYELMVILSPQLTEAETEKLYSEIKGFFDEVLFEDIWGKRKFAYPIRKFAEGYYVVWNFRVDVDKVSDLYEFLRLHPTVLRHLLVIVPESYVPKKHEELDEALDVFYEEKAEKAEKKRGGNRGGIKNAPASVEKAPSKLQISDKVNEVVEPKSPVSKPEQSDEESKTVPAVSSQPVSVETVAEKKKEDVLKSVKQPKEEDSIKTSESVDAKLDEKLKSIFDDELSF